MTRTVYISGPIRGYHDFNRQAFAEAAAWWRGQGFHVISPLEMDVQDELLGDPSMRATDKQIARDIDFVMKLRPGQDLVCSLPGWEKSEGATAEISLAKWRQVEVVLFGDALISKDPCGPAPPLKSTPFGLTSKQPSEAVMRSGAIRTFSTGATRDTDNGKLKYEGFFSPEVLRRRAEYMHEHRKQANGELRDADNWQKGMERAVYMDSLIRHACDAWYEWRTRSLKDADPTSLNRSKAFQDLLCAISFNAEGMLLELLRGRDVGRETIKEVRCE